MDTETEDGFWYLVLSRLRGMMRVERVLISREEQRIDHRLESPARFTLPPSLRFSVEGVVRDLVNPPPLAEESIEVIRWILTPSPDRPDIQGVNPAPVRPRPTSPAPADPAETRFSLLELD